MNRLARTVIIVSGATLALSLGGGGVAGAGADPPGPGSPGARDDRGRGAGDYTSVREKF